MLGKPNEFGYVTQLAEVTEHTRRGARIDPEHPLTRSGRANDRGRFARQEFSAASSLVAVLGAIGIYLLLAALLGLPSHSPPETAEGREQRKLLGAAGRYGNRPPCPKAPVA